MIEHLDPMTNYMTREQFVSLVDYFCPNLENLIALGGADITTDNFKIFRIDDEFYILHIESGIIVKWYKHLGRTNSFNQEISIECFIEFLKLLRSEI